jgi:hypothetical protein
MAIACQLVAKVLGDMPALMIRQESGVWWLHDTNKHSLALAKGRFKAPRYIDYSMSQVGLSVGILIGILAECWFDNIALRRRNTHDSHVSLASRILLASVRHRRSSFGSCRPSIASMEFVYIHEAKSLLSKLVDQAVNREEVTIARAS